MEALGVEPIAIPPPAVPLFRSGAEAAAHGMEDVDNPSSEAIAGYEKLYDKYPRIREGNPEFE